jgi:tetratricopeptide (TPR) repeat protein
MRDGGREIGWALGVTMLASLAACGGHVGAGSSGVTLRDAPKESIDGARVTGEARAIWDAAHASFAMHEEHGWSPGACDEVRAAFGAAREAQGGELPEADYMIGLTHTRCGEVSAARQRYEEILASHPAMCEARVGLGLSLEEEGDVVRALSTYGEALRHGAICPAAHVNIARLAARGDANAHDSAVGHLRRALELRTDFVPALHELSLLHLRRVRTPGAIEATERLVEKIHEIDPGYAPAINTLGLVALELGDLAAALARFQRTVEIDPSLYEAHLNFGQVALREGKYEAAREAFERAAGIEPHAYAPIVGLAAALRGLGSLEQAEERYARARASAPRRADPQGDLVTLVEAHLATLAATPEDRVASFRTKYPWYDVLAVAYALAEIHVRRGSPQDTVSAFREFLRDYEAILEPFEEANAHLHVARALIALDRHAEADAHFAAIGALWEEGVVDRVLASESMPEARKARAIFAVIEALAEAKFREAEAAHEAFRAIDAPKLSGARTMDGVLEWANESFLPFIQKKQGALVAAESKYNEIAALRVELPEGVVLKSARWQIAAAARVGMMYRELVRSFHDAPVPEEVERDAELLSIYRATIDGPIQPLREAAGERFLFCLKSGSSLGDVTEWSSTCASEIRLLDLARFSSAAKHHRLRGHAIGAPARPSPIDIGGGWTRGGRGSRGE